MLQDGKQQHNTFPQGMEFWSQMLIHRLVHVEIPSAIILALTSYVLERSLHAVLDSTEA